MESFITGTRLCFAQRRQDQLKVGRRVSPISSYQNFIFLGLNFCSPGIIFLNHRFANYGSNE